MTVQPRSLLIKNLTPGLPERGKVKIGTKGKKITSQAGNEFQPPQKLDHFLITTMERGPDDNFKRDEAIHAKLGDKPTRIPVRLLYDAIDLNFQSRYAAFKGKTLWCVGDGEVADRLKGAGPERERVGCPCHRIEPGYEGADRCKFNGVLSVLIEGAGGVGGVWKFRTTSYNSVVGLMSSLALIKRITGGPLAGIPLMLTVTAKTGMDPKGKAQKVYVVGIEFVGDIEQLQAEGYKIALTQAQHHQRIEGIETEARALLTAPTAPGAVFADENADEIAVEFYPETSGNGANGNGASKPAGSRLDALEETIKTEDPPHDPETGEVLPPLGDDGRDDLGLLPIEQVADPADLLALASRLETDMQTHETQAALKTWFSDSPDVTRLRDGGGDFYADLLGKVKSRMKALKK